MRLSILNYEGTIFLHDTDPNSKDLLPSGYCGDAYRIVDYVKCNHPELDMITMPVWREGLTMIKRNADRRIKKY